MYNEFNGPMRMGIVRFDQNLLLQDLAHAYAVFDGCLVVEVERSADIVDEKLEEYFFEYLLTHPHFDEVQPNAEVPRYNAVVRGGVREWVRVEAEPTTKCLLDPGEIDTTQAHEGIFRVRLADAVRSGFSVPLTPYTKPDKVEVAMGGVKIGYLDCPDITPEEHKSTPLLTQFFSELPVDESVDWLWGKDPLLKIERMLAEEGLPSAPFKL